MLCRCYFLSSLSVFFDDRLEQRDLGNYKTNLHQIFRDGRHVGVDVGSRPSDNYFRSVCLFVCLSVCLFVCAEFFPAVFDPIWIKLRHMLHARV